MQGPEVVVLVLKAGVSRIATSNCGMVVFNVVQ